MIKKILKRSFNIIGLTVKKIRSKEVEKIEFVKSYLLSEQRCTIFDVGAYDGETAKCFNSVFDKNCIIHAFEPFKKSFDLLEANTAQFNNIVLNNVALGKDNLTKDLNINSFEGTNSFLDVDKEVLKYWNSEIYQPIEKVSIPVVSIDNYLASNKIDEIHVLKLDTQGTELDVLLGAEKAIGAGKIKMVLIEMIVVPTYAGQPSFEKQLKTLKKLGFILLRLFENLDSRKRVRFFDGVFIHNTYLNKQR